MDLRIRSLKPRWPEVKRRLALLADGLLAVRNFLWPLLRRLGCIRLRRRSAVDCTPLKGIADRGFKILETHPAFEEDLLNYFDGVDFLFPRQNRLNFLLAHETAEFSQAVELSLVDQGQRKGDLAVHGDMISEGVEQRSHDGGQIEVGNRDRVLDAGEEFCGYPDRDPTVFFGFHKGTIARGEGAKKSTIASLQRMSLV